ncbi:MULTISPECIES: cell division protein ZapA [unclassified Devosia]|uniref:cell division protein ZapA n=1 Tax=unclassified Devosia TaxID=196773 RepID=UPI00145D9213|nr:cell division protein ZapA [Devosia sp. MC521]MBJ6987966.1 cell division protein ZapA [Devosia sp. MC521]MBJ7578509.1 cell division protein ZapA [Devosia sp. MC532]MBK1794697.1 cell division protein ZapA [Devosia sp. WQ 349K1]QMW62043.1 cell division protein ZapA [Devosia sp. MC521]
MPEVNVEINGRKYRMACEAGQQGHLMRLAERFDAEVEALKGAVGEIGDTRLTVMAGIAVMDELTEAEKRIAALEEQVALLTEAGQGIAEELEQTERKFTQKLDEASRTIESIASVLEQTAPVAN